MNHLDKIKEYMRYGIICEHKTGYLCMHREEKLKEIIQSVAQATRERDIAEIDKILIEATSWGEEGWLPSAIEALRNL